VTTTDTAAGQASDSMRNGVDTATLFATLDAVSRRPRQPNSSSAPTTSGSAAPRARHRGVRDHTGARHHHNHASGTGSATTSGLDLGEGGLLR
jgi:hypothetical protein